MSAMTGFESYNEICAVRIELLETEPLIWREVEVPTSVTLKVLHDVIQITVGWFDCHLWRFTIGGQSYGPLMPGVRDDDAPGDATKVRLRDVLESDTTIIDYLYDFGDSWEHRLAVTNIRQGDPDVSYPRYVGANGPVRLKTAAAFPASTPPSMPWLTSRIPNMPRLWSGSTNTIRSTSMSCH